MKTIYIALSLFIVGSFVGGCGSAEPEVTKAEESSFRNPPKEMPEAARKSMEEAMKNRGGNR